MSMPPFFVDEMVKERREHFLRMARQSRLEHEARSGRRQPAITRRAVLLAAKWMISLGQALKQAGSLPVETQPAADFYDPCETC